MSTIPIIAFSAWSGTGKTAVIERLIPVLKKKGLKVAAVKHDAHDFEIDREGKDSWRFSHAGADVTLIQSQSKTALIDQRSLDLADALSMIRDVDIILAEGYNNLLPDAPEASGTSDRSQEHHSGQSYPLYRIGISRKSTGKELRISASDCIAVMTDDPFLSAPTGVRVFALNDIAKMADFLVDLSLLSD